MIKYFWTRYLAVYPDTLLYMLQNTEYRLGNYATWYNRTADFRHVMKRRTLDVTPKIKLLRIGLWVIWFVMVIGTSLCLYLSITTKLYVWGVAGLGLIALLPFVMAYGIVVPLLIGGWLIQKPREKAIINSARQIFSGHKGARIAVVGSFGKTTAKEILATVLSEGLKVAMTPGNMNTAIGISRFARKLSGDEDVLVIEYGEERVGDVKRLAELTRPTMGVITGINEAHLVSFKSIERTIATIFELPDYLGDDAVLYKNKENKLVADNIDHDDPLAYSRHGVDGWRITELETSLEGTTFIAAKGSKKVSADTRLIGLHTVGVTVMAIAVADSFGLTVKQIEAGLGKIKPFEHRMEPRKVHGALVIDDTYNGNSDGVAAGLELLKTTKARRRIYVTPGLVEQGDKTAEVHRTIGQQAAQSADMVVLMKNSVTDYIVEGLKKAKFAGELLIIDDPLDFYTNLDQFVAAGDVVLMQNDWTDNYV